MQAKAQGFGGSKIKIGRPHARGRRADRRRARGGGAGFEIFTDANQAFTVDEAIRRARALRDRSTSAGSRSRCRRTTSTGTCGCAAATHCPSPSARASTALLHFREYLQRGACSIVQVDVGAYRRHHALAEGRPSGRDLQRRGLPAFPDGAARRRSAAPCPMRAGSNTSRSSTTITTRSHAIVNGHARPSSDAGPRHRMGLRRHQTSHRRRHDRDDHCPLRASTAS